MAVTFNGYGLFLFLVAFRLQLVAQICDLGKGFSAIATHLELENPAGSPSGVFW